jgi:hypothetical protein
LGNIGVISPTKVSLELVFPKLAYKGVNDAMGEAIYHEITLLGPLELPQLCA